MSFFDYIYADRSRLQQSRAAGPTIHVAQCERCLNPFDYRLRKSGKQRDSVEYEPLRKKLMIADANHDPVVCDGCFVDIMSSITPLPMSDGLANSNLPLVLRTADLEEREF